MAAVRVALQGTTPSPRHGVIRGGTWLHLGYQPVRRQTARP